MNQRKKVHVLLGVFVVGLGVGACAPPEGETLSEEQQIGWFSDGSWIVRDIHDEMSRRAFENTRMVVGGRNWLDQAGFLAGTDEADEASLYKDPPKYHFMRQSTVSSYQACQDSVNAIIALVQQAFTSLQQGDHYAFSWYIGIGAHVIQDSTCSEHAERRQDSTPPYSALLKLCVGSGDSVPPGACQHSGADEFWLSIDPGALFGVGVNATTGYLLAVRSLRVAGTWDPATIRSTLLSTFNFSNGSIYRGYLNCTGLPTTDVITPQPTIPCGSRRCRADQICCEPNVCINKGQMCP